MELLRFPYRYLFVLLSVFKQLIFKLHIRGIFGIQDWKLLSFIVSPCYDIAMPE